MLWVFFALTASIVNAIYYLCNQNIRLQSSIFMIYRGIVVALMAVPFLFFYQPIDAWQFYAIAIVQGLITSYNDFTTLNANKQYGAETVSSILPMNVGFVFILWCLIEPLIIISYLSLPIKSLLIILSIAGISFALSKYRQVKINRKAFISLLPVMILSAVISIFNKKIMDYALDSLLGLCFWRVFISSLTVGFVHLVIYIHHRRPIGLLYDKSNLSRLWIFLFMPISMVCRNMAMYYTENPSYVASIVQCSLLWIIFFNRHVPFIKFKKIYMKMDKKWAFLMLASAIVLILATQK